MSDEEALRYSLRAFNILLWLANRGISCKSIGKVGRRQCKRLRLGSNTDFEAVRESIGSIIASIDSSHVEIRRMADNMEGALGSCFV